MPAAEAEDAAPTLGFACAWEQEAARTWSLIPWHLRDALAGRIAVVDLDVGLPAWQRAVLKAAYVRRRDGKWNSRWKWSAPAEALVARRLRAAAAETRPDVVLEIGDYGPVELPFILYQDMSFATMDDHYDELRPYLWLDRATIRRRAARQADVYRRAAAVLTMSEWLARDLRERQILAPDRIQVVGAGISTPGTDTTVRTDPSGPGPRGRLLFVGRDFHRKAGDVVVAATQLLRRQDRAVTLTIAGPSRWPMVGPVPDGVDFVGYRTPSEVEQLYRSHDVFVMPSRFEPFGIAYLEALAHGLPCIGRRAFAAPEFIVPGKNGELVDGDDPSQTAEAVARVLGGPEYFRRCSADAEHVRAHYSWDATAARIVDAVASIRS